MERSALGPDTESVGSSLVNAEYAQPVAGASHGAACQTASAESMLPSSRYMSIRSKLVMVLSLVGLILLMICVGVTILDFNSKLSRICLERATVAAALVRNAIHAGGTAAEINDLMVAAVGKTGFKALALSDSSGKIIATSEPQWMEQSVDRLMQPMAALDLEHDTKRFIAFVHPKDGIVSYVADATRAGEKPSKILIQIDSRPDAEALNVIAWNMMVWRIVGVILSVLIISLALHRIFIQPIESLWRFAQTRAKHDYSPNFQDDELDMIREILNQSIEATNVRDLALADMAMRDGLTGLGNRTFFKAKLAEAIELAGQRNEKLGVFMLNLNQFKDVNDTVGHDAGDQVLRRTAEILKSCCGENDIVARVSGDEFGVLLTNLDGADEAIDFANRFMRAVSAPFRIGPHELHLNSCVGITLFPQDGRDKEVLVKNADLALSRAKHEGAGSCSLYRHELHLRSIERNTIERDLRQALVRGQLELYYQPKISVTDGGITGVEALIRWRHPERGYISPTVFIPVAERCGMIADLTRWVLDEACRQNRDWQVRGLPKISVAVNVSAIDLRRADLTDAIANLLVHHGLSPQYLELEVTESMVMRDVDMVIGTLRRLRGLGVGISIDDFGTGYSSLAYLKRFPVKRLKIDRSFVNDIANKRGGQVIPKVIIDLAHALGIHVVAEGVETAMQLDMLRELGCDEAQGFLLGRPMPASEFELYLAHQPAGGMTSDAKRHGSAA